MFFPQCRLLVWGLSAAVSPRGLDMWDGRLGLPKAACAEERVEQAGEPAHDGDEGDLVRLAVGGQGFVTGIGGRFPAVRGRSCHVEQLEELAGVAVEGGEAEQGIGIGAAQAAELGHAGAEAGGVDRDGVGDRQDYGVPKGECGVGRDAIAHSAVVRSDVGREGLEDVGPAAAGLGVEFGPELAQGAELPDKLAAEGEKVVAALQFVRSRRRALQATDEAEAGENRGIDAVVLCEPPGDLGEVAGALMQGSSNCSVTCST